MGGTMTGGQRTATSRRTPDSRTLSRLRTHYRGSTALSNRALFWGAPLVGAALLSAVPAAGNPTGGSVVGGSATISGEGTGNVTVNQTTDRAILHWDDFSIGNGETTQFVQPGSGSIAVNRVTGTAESILLGTLTANGNVWIINPNGLTAGAGAIIDVNGFLASTADILDSDILDGDDRFSFNIPSVNPDASIVNLGQISVGERGLAALVAPGVENDGLIVGRMAQVVLGGAETFTLDFAGDGLLSFEVASPVTSAPNGMTDLVTNSGIIDAPGGYVLLTADSIDGVVDNVINMSGVIRAESLTTANGTVVLSGGDQGVVRVSGTIDASGSDPGETGGTVNVLGELIALDLGTEIDASGDAGGGTVLVGGDAHGGGDVQRARRTAMVSETVIDVSATGNGDGGKAVIWADEHTYMSGHIDARGGPQGGDGGFVEVSGVESLGFYGTIDASAPLGTMGSILFDPTDVIIQADIDPDRDDGQISDGIILSGEAPAEMRISEAALEAVAGSVTIEATRNIQVGQLTDGTLSFQAGAGQQVTFTADADSNGEGAITFDNLGNTISTAGGDIVFSAANMTLGILDAGTGAVSLTSTGTGGAGILALRGINAGSLDLSSGSSIIQAAGGLVVTNDTKLAAGGTITLDSATNQLGGDISISSGSTAIIDNDATTTTLGAVNLSGNLALDLTGGLGQSGATTVSAAAVSVQAAGPVALTNSNTFATVAASVTGDGNGFSITEGTDGFTVGSIGGVVGITTVNGAVDLGVGANTLTLAQDISSGTAAITGDASTISVSSTAAQIQDAVDVSASGATITVASGTFSETVVVDQALTFNGAQVGVDARGRTATETIVSGGFELQGTADNVTIDGFTIQDGAAIGAQNAGVVIASGATGATVQNTIFSRSGTVDADTFHGIVTATNGGNTPLTITQNSFSGWDTGVLLNPGATSAQVTNNLFSGNFVGASVDGPSGTVITGNSFANNASEGLRLDQNSTDATDTATLTLTGNDFSGTATLVALTADVEVDATGNSLDGTAFSGLTVNQLLALEDQISHGIDDPAGGFTGFVRTRANNVFVTTNSGSIQRGLDRAATGDTVNVGGGTYGGDLTIGADTIFNFVGGVIVDSVTSNAGTTVQFGGSLGTTGGNLSFNGAVTLTGDTQLDTDVAGGTSNAGNVTFASTVDGPFSLNIDATADGGGTGGTVSLNAVGSTTQVSAVDVSGGTVNFGGTISTSGSINVASDSSITVNQVLATTGTDTVTLTAGTDIDVQNTITSVDGDIGLTAGNDITFDAAGDVTSTTGNVTVTADSNGDANGSGGAISMADGTLINAGSGTIALSADESITLGGLSTTGQVTLASTSGAIADGGDTVTDVVASSLAITANGAAGTVANPLETQVSTLAGTVGELAITNTGDIAVASVGGETGITANSGGVNIAAASTITVTNAISASGAGTVDLDATDDIVVNNTIDSENGAITLLADNDVTFAAAGDVTSLTGNITVTADADAVADAGTGGAVTMDTGTVINAGTGTIDITADETLTLGSLVTTNAVTLQSVSGAIVLGGTTGGSLSATATSGTITDAAGTTQSIGGLATFNAGTNTVTLGDDGSDTTNFGTLNLTGGTVTVTEDSATELTGVSADSLSLTSTGPITDATGTSLAVTNQATFNAGSSGITLGGDTGDTTNFGTLNLTGGTVVVSEDSPTELTGVTADSLSLTSTGAITDAVGTTLAVTNLATFNAGGNAVTLGDDVTDVTNFGTLNLTGGTVTVTEDSATELTGVTADSLSLTSNGAITDSANAALAVTNLATFNAGGNAITLGDTGTDTANFGTLNLTGGTVAVNEDSGTELTGVSADSLSLTSDGAITDSANAVLAVTNLATFNAGSNTVTLGDTLTDTANFGSLNLTGGTVAVTEDSATILAGVSATNLTLVADGTITDTGTVTVTDTANLTAVSGGAAQDIELNDGSNDFGTVISSGAVVTLQDTGGIVLGNTTATTSLSVTSTGTITDSANAVLDVTGLATFDAGGNAVTLGDTGTDSANFGSLNLTGGTVEVTENSATVLAGASTTDLTLNSEGTITDTGTVTVGGIADLTASSGGAAQDIELNEAGNDFGTVASNGDNVTLTDTNAIVLGATTVATNLVVTASGISQVGSTAVDVDGTTTLNSAGANIDLTETGNDFTGAVASTGANISLTDTNAIVLGNTTAGSDLVVTATGISQAALTTVDVNGTTTLNSTGASIALDQSTNDFTGAVASTGTSVTLQDTNAIVVGATSATSLNVTAGGAITDADGTTITADTLTVSSGAEITLNNGHAIGTLASATRVGSLELIDSSGGLTIGAGGIDEGVGAVTVTTSGGALTVNGGIAADADTVTLTGDGVAFGADGDVDSGSGDINVVAGTGAISTASGTTLLSTGTIDLFAGSLALNTGALSQVGGSSLGGGQATNVVLRSQASTTVGFGTGATGTYNVSDGELDTIRAANLQVGDATAGNLDVGAATLTSATASTTLTLNSGGAVSQTGGALDMSAGSGGLLVQSTGSAALGNTGNNLGVVAATVGAGSSVTLANSDALTIGTVGGVAGITAPGGVTITSATGGVTVDNDIVATGGDVSVTAGGDDQTLANNAVIDGTNVSLFADRMVLGSGSDRIVADSVVTLASANAGDTINVGSAGNSATDELELSIVELGTVTAPGALRIGSTSAGSLTVSAALANPSAGTDTVSLLSGGTVSQTAAITVDNLRVEGSTIDLDLATNDIDQFAANASSQIDYVDANTLTVGSVDGVDGVTNTNVSGIVEITADDINIIQPITAPLALFLNPATGGREVAIGGSPAFPGTQLGVSDAELDNIVTANLVVGFESGVSDTSDASTYTAGSYTFGTISDAGTSTIDNMLLFANGDMTFSGTVDGSFDLRLDFSGDVNFDAAVGSSTRLGSVQFNTPTTGTTTGDVFVNNDAITDPFSFNAASVNINIAGSITSNQTLIGTAANFDGFNVDSLFVQRAAAVALFGSIAGDDTQTAASQGATSGPNPDAFFNGCLIGTIQCFNVPVILPVAGLDLSLDDERLLREPLEEEDEEFEDLLSNTGNEELW